MRSWTLEEGQTMAEYAVVLAVITPIVVLAFATFGNAIIPVIDFGAFYVMGWNGDPCPGAVSVPKGYIAGHFIKYIPRNPKGSGDTACYLNDPTQLTPCAAVLTR